MRREVANADTVLSVLRQAEARRVVATTNANLESSRGHGIYDIFITRLAGGVQTSSVLRLVDLAGSEQVCLHHPRLPST